MGGRSHLTPGLAAAPGQVFPSLPALLRRDGDDRTQPLQDCPSSLLSGAGDSCCSTVGATPVGSALLPDTLCTGGIQPSQTQPAQAQPALFQPYSRAWGGQLPGATPAEPVSPSHRAGEHSAPPAGGGRGSGAVLWAGWRREKESQGTGGGRASGWKAHSHLLLCCPPLPTTLNSLEKRFNKPDPRLWLVLQH